MEKVYKPKKNHKLRKARESRGFHGFEIAERLGMGLMRYMVIEMEWEEATEEEVLKICGFFRMDVRALGFGRQFWSLCLNALPRDHTPRKRHNDAIKSVVKRSEMV